MVVYFYRAFLVFAFFFSTRTLTAYSDTFYSQWDQDKFLIDEIFHYKQEGYFVDIGATNGVHINNTYYMEKNLKWRGVCIEPQSDFFSKLCKNRTCACLDVVLDSCEQTVEFFDGDTEGCTAGGIIATDTDNTPNHIHIQHLPKNMKHLRKTKPLDMVLKECGAPPVIDYLSIDVEGAESRILMPFSLDDWRVLVLSIERPKPELQEKLLQNGYTYLVQIGEDKIYVHKSIPNFDEIMDLKKRLPPYFEQYTINRSYIIHRSTS